MRLDGHIHIWDGSQDRDDFLERLKTCGFGGGLVISLPPPSFPELAKPRSPRERLDNLFYWTSSSPHLYPIFWVDPLEEDVIDQVATAIERGVAGFKVICDRFYPSDERAMRVFRAIADRGKPILFHSGILWDGKPSSRYNRPSDFEALLEIDGLRFTLAHLSWPWCDELIAVYGKFLNAHSRRPGVSVEMFVDMTPGTPTAYRRDVLTKLFKVGYNVGKNLVFGSDCNVNEYNIDWTTKWLALDSEIFQELELSRQMIDGIFGKNLLRFLGIRQENKQH